MRVCWPRNIFPCSFSSNSDAVEIMAKLGGAEDLWAFFRSTEFGVFVPVELEWRSTLACLLVTSAFVILVSIAYQWWKESPEYGKNVGPTVYPLLGSLPLFLMNKHRWIDWAEEELRKTPTLTMRQVMPGGGLSIETANPANVEHFLKTRFDNYPKGADIAEIFHDLLGNGIFNVNGECWLMQRKAASIEFGAHSLRILLMECVEKEMQERLHPILLNAAHAGTCINLEDLLLRLVFDNVAAMSFGMDLECLHESMPRVDFAEAFDEAGLLCLGRFFSFSPVWKAMRYLNIGNERRIRQCVDTIDKFAYGVIQKRRKELRTGGARSHRDMLSRFMRLMAEQNVSPTGSPRAKKEGQDTEAIDRAVLKEQCSDMFLKDIVVSFLIAGREAPALILTWFFWYLSQHPHVEQALQDEFASILQARKTGGIGGKKKGAKTSAAKDSVAGLTGTRVQDTDSCTSTSSSSSSSSEEESEEEVEVNSPPASSPFPIFTLAELKNMHYLHAALTETMRLYHPVAFIPRVALEDDVFPDGTVVPKGSRVGYYPMAMARMESIWGSDCLEFKPERWLKDGEFRAVSPYKFPVFSAGPRLCLGKDIAMIQMKAIAAALIPCFQLQPAPGHVAEVHISITVRMKGGMPVYVRPRAAQSAAA